MFSILQMYDTLLVHFGNQEWWPVDESYHLKQKTDPRFEIILGAILTQNTAWKNVEKALQQLKQARCLSIQAVKEIDEKKLKKMIQPSGFFNQKAERITLFVNYIATKYNSDLNRFFNQETRDIRKELFSLKGIGPETADSILLYAGNHPVFVVDAYTTRVSTRIPFSMSKYTYETIQQYFTKEIEKRYTSKQKRVEVYKQLHALIVEQAKNYCKKKPLCSDCPLHKNCSYPLVQ